MGVGECLSKAGQGYEGSPQLQLPSLHMLHHLDTPHLKSERYLDQRLGTDRSNKCLGTSGLDSRLAVPQSYRRRSQCASVYEMISMGTVQHERVMRLLLQQLSNYHSAGTTRGNRILTGLR